MARPLMDWLQGGERASGEEGGLPAQLNSQLRTGAPTGTGYLVGRIGSCSLPWSTFLPHYLKKKPVEYAASSCSGNLTGEL